MDRPDGWMKGIDRIATGDNLGHPARPCEPNDNVNEWFLGDKLSLGRRKALIDGRRHYLIGPASTMVETLPTGGQFEYVCRLFGIPYKGGIAVQESGAFWKFSIRETA